MNKAETYKNLISKRQSFDFKKIGLRNYSEGGFKNDYVDGWEQWHNDLNAEIMLVGQDFADWETFIKCDGKVEPEKDKYKYPTDKYLVQLFREELGIEIGHPWTTSTASLFFTNAIVGLKENGMQGKPEKRWIETGRDEFLRPLIEIVQPKIIIALGQIPFQSVCAAIPDMINICPKISFNFKDIVEHSPYTAKNGMLVFAVFHCGGGGVRNRTREQQIMDWKKISQYRPPQLRK